MHRRQTLTLALLLAALVAPSAHAQPAYQVADLATAPFADPGIVFMPAVVEELDGVGYFFHDDGTHGMELWRSDGSAIGTYLLRDLCPGNCGALASRSLENTRAVGGHLFFAANDGAHGVELWVSDGTALGTRLVRDIHPGPSSSAPGWMTLAAGQLFFLADDGAHGRELWRSDGTPKGTYLVADLAPGAASLEAGAFAEGGGKLFFNVISNGQVGGLWVSDGTAAGSFHLSDVTSFANALFKGTPFLTLPDGRLLFSGNDSTVTENYELWISDGTPGGTTLLADLNGSPSGSNPTSFVRLGAWIYFTANSVVDPTRRTYWKSDGTLAGTVELPSPPDMSAIGYPPSLFAKVGSTLFFAAGTPATGVELFRISGDVASLVEDIRPGVESSIDWFAGYPYSNQALFAASGDRLLLLANDGVHGVEFWSSDGTSVGTVLVSSITPDATPPAFDPSLSLRHEPSLGSSLIVRDFDPTSGYRLWRVDAQPESASLLRTLGAHQSSFLPTRTSWFLYAPPGPTCLEAAGDRVVFRTFDATAWAYPAWGTDGTTAGTEPLGAATTSSDVSCHSLDNQVLLLARFQPPGVELLRSDGTAVGTQSITTIAGIGGWGLSEPTFAGHGTLAAFAAEGILWTTDGSTVSNETPVPDYQPVGLVSSTTGHLYIEDFELSRYDESSGSSALVADLNGLEASYPSDLAELGDGSLVFSAFETAIGRELFVTDGTPGGTALVRDIRPGSVGGLEPNSDLFLPFGQRQEITALGSMALFAADDGTLGAELWVTDGTALGTHLLKDIYPGDYPSTPRNLTRFDDRVFFTAESELEGLELWATDGTYEGTVLLKDIAPGTASSLPDDLVVRDGVLYFSAWSPNYGREAWKSDGTSAGTVRITDIAPGPKSSSPQRFARAGNRLFFSATDHVHGYELWAISDDGGIPLFLDGFENESTSRWSEVEP